MHYLSIKYLQPGMVLAKPIIGDNGSVLLKEKNKITDITLKRLREMGFQGAYLDTPLFSEIEVDDIIDSDLRLQAFRALQVWDVPKAVQAAKQIVQVLKYKDVLKLDLLDIKNDKNYLYKHCISVCIFSVVLGIAMDMRVEQLESLAVAGLLHDIGMKDLKEELLTSTEKFSQAEMQEMKEHPKLGFELLKEYPMVTSVSRNAILFHHENLNGTGYYEAFDEQLSIFSKILRVADVYDSLTAMKKYREAQSPAEAIEYLMANTGTLFDKEIVGVFVKKFPLYPVGFTVRLSNGEAGVIMSNHSNAMRPKIKLLKGKIIDLSVDADYRSVIIKEIM